MVDKVAMDMSTSGSKTPEEQAKHDAEMLKVADTGVTKIIHTDSKRPDRNVDLTQVSPTDDVTARPDDIPEKFWDVEKGIVNVEALLKSQKDGEDALRTAQQTDKDKPKVDDKSTDGDDKTGDQTIVDQPKVVQDASAEFAKDGQLSDETYTALEASGLSKDMVNQYIEGQKAIVGGLQAAAAEPFGSSDKFDAAADWAAANLNEDEIKVLDVQLTSMNPAIVKQGAAALQVKYAANADITPDVTISGTGNPVSGTSFQSSAEMQSAMSDPRYKTDEAFRLEVAGKIKRSSAKLLG